jgi:hypothetical protein
VGALAAGSAHAQSNFDVRYLYYQESAGRTKVLNPWIGINQDFGLRGGTLSLLFAYDTITGASPSGAYPTIDATTSASAAGSSSIPMVAYTDTRTSVTASYAHRFGAHFPSIDISYSKEDDYLARGAGIADSWTLARGRGTLHMAAAISRDVVTPVTTHVSSDKSSNAIALGWSWIIGERDLIDLSGSWVNLSGYLTDPYKVVPVGSTTVPENRPDSRSRKAILLKYGHFFIDARGALKTAFRIYWDDWAIRAYTLDLVYDQRVGSDWIVTPEIRLYSQNSASFFAYEFAVPQPYMSSDYRLSSFYSVLGGLTVSYQFPHDITLSLGAAYQWQYGLDRVTPRIAVPPPVTAAFEDGGDEGEGEGGPALVSPADLTTITGTVGLSWRY